MIINFDQLSGIRRKYADKKIIFRAGVFDLLHDGHVQALKYSKEQGDILVVGVQSDIRVKQNKGEDRPINNESIRQTTVDAIRWVDYVFIMPLPAGEIRSTFQVITSLKPDVFIDRNDWSDAADFMCSVGTNFLLDAQQKINSTTSIISKIIHRMNVNKK